MSEMLGVAVLFRRRFDDMDFHMRLRECAKDCNVSLCQIAGYDVNVIDSIGLPVTY
jgi:hypothetical protein